MREWQALALVVVLTIIAVTLAVLVAQVDHIIGDIDHGKFMPFIYTGES